MPKIFLHIGLHKTATKYFQHYVLPFLDKKSFIYNPSKLTQYIMDYLKADEEDCNSVYQNLIKEKNRLLNENDNSKLIISREIMSGDLLTGYADWDYSMDKIYSIMPDANIIIFLRYQPDWLLSCYRESIHEHHYQLIDKFLCFDKKNNDFFKPPNERNENRYAYLYALGLDYVKMLKKIFTLYSKEQVKIFFYENFLGNKHKVVSSILNTIGSTRIPHINSNIIPNRGFSAFSIYLSILRAKFFKGICFKYLVHRPIYFFGEKGIPAGNESLSILPKYKYWSSYFKRNDEEVRSDNYPDITLVEKIKREFSWRFFIKNRLDRLFYLDWDILKKYRQRLNQHYKKINKDLLKLLEGETEIPKEYYL